MADGVLLRLCLTVVRNRFYRVTFGSKKASKLKIKGFGTSAILFRIIRFSKNKMETFKNPTVNTSEEKSGGKSRKN